MDARVVALMLDELEVPAGSVQRVATREAAIGMLRVSTIDIVLLDLDLPDSEGLETVRGLLACGVDVPVVVLTGHGDDELGRQAVASGAQDYLVKDDVNANVLARVVQFAVTRHRLLMQVRLQSTGSNAASMDAAPGDTRDTVEEAQRLAQASAIDVIEGAYEGAIEGWSRVLELRDSDTMGHSRRVADLAVALARHLGLPDEELDPLRRGALLHDIGKIAVPDAILRKQGPLDDGERIAMERHTMFARDLLEPIEFLRTAIDVPYAHHERWDGSGYPQGLVGDDIPLAARIFAVVDVYDALTRDRPYRSAWSHEDARAYIAAEAGRLFDPDVVTAFVALNS